MKHLGLGLGLYFCKWLQKKKRRKRISIIHIDVSVGLKFIKLLKGPRARREELQSGNERRLFFKKKIHIWCHFANHVSDQIYLRRCTFSWAHLSVIKSQQQPQIILGWYAFLNNFVYEIHNFIKYLNIHLYVGRFIIHLFIHSPFILLFNKYLLTPLMFQAHFQMPEKQQH